MTEQTSPRTGADADRSAVLGSLLVVGAALCFATLGPLSRLAYEEGMTPLTFVAWRAAIGAVVLAAFLLLMARRGRPIVTWRDVPRRQWVVVVLAGSASAFMNLAIFVAFERISIALAMLGFYTYPAIVAVVVVVTGRERLDGGRIAALLLALVGMALVVLGQATPEGAPGADLLGVILVLAAACLNVVYLFAARDGYLALPAREAALAVLVVAEAWYLALALVVGQTSVLAQPLVDPALLMLLLVAGIVGAALAIVLFTAGLRLVGGVRTSILMLLEPVAASVLALFVLGEALTWVQVIGGALVLAGAILVERRRSVGSGQALGPVVAPMGD
ncbi:MAG TPA: DMT family transporter [Candidatus Limnocylindrales bacterium]